ncbi:Polyketide synthase [Mycena indigotica]|uniref:Polyketide synthase n=1 Tax=Mycena indigotica TaxID=2126181 RepID=A0A8H6WG80_9AGAR|nr:Polyketide synthase [Mycena indigotica]KAF7315556.1 Polyketide synthase [Mycena indigotica]
MAKPLELIFSSVDGLDLYLDVYLPSTDTGTTKVPVLLWWHAVEKYGICVVSADYRLAPQSRLPAILADCKAAMEFVQSPAFAEATSNSVDSAKLVVSGSSAGGWLSLLNGTGIGYAACGLDPPPRVLGIAALYPITDLADPFWTTKQRPVSYFPRVIPDEEVASFVDPTSAKISFTTPESPRSVLYHYMVQEGILEKLLLEGTGISASAVAIAPQIKTGKFDVPPVYQIHGDIDDKVPCQQARDVEAALREINGVEHVYEELPGVDHLFDKDASYGMENMYAFVQRVTK